MSERDEGTTDGRRARGAKRRAEIIDATLAVVTRDGAAGVSHRTVAEQAGMTTSLSTYYFATLDDLLVAALSSVADSYSARIEALIDSSDDALRGLAELIVESGGSGRARALAERELSTLAARRPALAPVARQWRDDVAALVGTLTDDPDAVAAVVAASDGLCTAMLLGHAPADLGHVHAILVRALGRDGPTSGCGAGR